MRENMRCMQQVICPWIRWEGLTPMDNRSMKFLRYNHETTANSVHRSSKSHQSWKTPTKPRAYIEDKVLFVLTGTMFITQTGKVLSAAANPPRLAFISMTFRMSVLLTPIRFQYSRTCSRQYIVSELKLSKVIPVDKFHKNVQRRGPDISKLYYFLSVWWKIETDRYIKIHKSDKTDYCTQIRLLKVLIILMIITACKTVLMKIFKESKIFQDC